jgi:hypothetical protein
LANEWHMQKMYILFWVKFGVLFLI